jgi:hypothetical protein
MQELSHDQGPWTHLMPYVPWMIPRCFIRGDRPQFLCPLGYTKSQSKQDETGWNRCIVHRYCRRSCYIALTFFPYFGLLHHFTPAKIIVSHTCQKVDKRIRFEIAGNTQILCAVCTWDSFYPTFWSLRGPRCFQRLERLCHCTAVAARAAATGAAEEVPLTRYIK